MNNGKLHIMICGSRENFNKSLAISDILLILNRYSDAVFHLGGARGVDTIALEFCNTYKLSYVIHLPVYEKYGKIAPLRRNEEMIKASDRIFAFWNGESRGTWFVISRAIELNVPLVVFYEGKEHA